MSSEPTKPSRPQIEQAGVNDESLQRVHSILLREKPEPSEGVSPMPLFLLGFISTMIFICSIYVVHYRGGLEHGFATAAMIYDERFDPARAAGAGAERELTLEDIVRLGRRVYTQQCAICHQANGMGVPGVYPPLVGSDWVVSSEERLIRVLLHGLVGEIQVLGNTYNGNMPAFAALGDERVAQVLTYIRQDWGNDAEPITAEQVRAAREASPRTTPWTQDELEAYR